MTHAVSTNGQYRLAIERHGDDIVVKMQDFAGRMIWAKMTDPALASIASEEQDDFFSKATLVPESPPDWMVLRGHETWERHGWSYDLYQGWSRIVPPEELALIGSNFEAPRAD